jgi:hypothetical protein
VRKVDDPSVCEPRRLTGLWVSTVSYRNSLVLYISVKCVKPIQHLSSNMNLELSEYRKYLSLTGYRMFTWLSILLQLHSELSLDPVMLHSWKGPKALLLYQVLAWILLRLV